MAITDQIIRLSEFDLQQRNYKQIDALRYDFRVTLPDGTEWDLGLDSDGNLDIWCQGSGKRVAILSHSANRISVMAVKLWVTEGK